MNSANNANKIQYLLFLLQTIILFAQGIFGNKLAELITISPLTILILSILSIVIILPISVSLTQKDLDLPSPHGLINTLLGRISTAFPLFAILGALGGTLFFYLSKDQGFMCLIPMNTVPGMPDACMGPYGYEIWNFLFLILLMVFTTFYKQKLAIILSCAIGFSTGASGAFILLESSRNEYFFTLVGWIVFAIAGALVISVLRIPELVSYLTRER